MKTLDLLLDFGYDINEKSKDGKTLLIVLCYYNNIFVVSYYIGNGANNYI